MVSVRVDDVNPAHVRLSVFVGPREGSRGHSGELVVRRPEVLDLAGDFYDALITGLASHKTDSGDLLGDLLDERP